MRKIIFSFITILALLFSSAAAFAQSPTYQPPTNYMNNQVGGSTSIGLSVPPAPSGPTYQARVIINGMQFIPTYLTVYTGTYVTWNNQDTVAHTVTSDDMTGTVRFDSGVLPPGHTFSYYFSQPGVYPYHCNIHPNMHGVINIINKPQPSTPAVSAPSQPAAPSSTPSASTQAYADAVNNYYAAQKAPQTTASVTPPLPSTGPADTAAIATITAVLGAGGYYIYLFRRKKLS